MRIISKNTIPYFLCLFLLAGCTNIGDGVLFLRGNFSESTQKQFDSCEISIVSATSKQKLLTEKIQGKFEVSLTVAPNGASYNTEINCTNEVSSIKVFSKNFEINKGTALVDFGLIEYQ